MKISKLISVALLSVIILCTGKGDAYAFFKLPLPPMPDINPINNATKLGTLMQAITESKEVVKSTGKNELLNNMKGSLPSLSVSSSPQSSEKNESKTPGKGKLKNNSTLGITKYGKDEKENFNAFYKLFFKYPKNTGEVAQLNDYALVKKVYKEQAQEYIQDIVVETYLVGRITEEYLDLVDRTLDRLDRCQKGYCNGNNRCTANNIGKYCTFFGLQMAYIETQNEDIEKTGEDTQGTLGAAMNAYIVTTVYDRLLRIVENLTAMEAQFRSALQIRLVEPMEENVDNHAQIKQSKKYKFAYSEHNDNVNAQKIIDVYDRFSACENGGENCPAQNSVKIKLRGMQDTAILDSISKLENIIVEAVDVHNLITTIDEYEYMYKQYAISKKVHDRALKALEDSDNCIEDFINEHSGAKGEKIWYDNTKASVIKKRNDYESRGGLSKTLINEYSKYVDDISLGKTDKCKGFYEKCPEGYIEDKDVKCDSNKDLKFCSLPLRESENKVSGMEIEQGDDENEVTISDMFITDDSSLSDKIEDENGYNSEKSWYIGQGKMMELTNNGTLTFKPWNDQQELQKAYIANKYRNMKIIIKSVDKGKAAYKIASTRAKTYNPSKEEAQEVVNKILECRSPDEIVNSDKDIIRNKIISGLGYAPYDIKIASENGYVVVKVKFSKETPYQEVKRFDQRIGSECYFKNEKNTKNVIFSRIGESTPWNFTKKMLVTEYFPRIWARTSVNADINNQADNFVKHIKKGKNEGGIERSIALDKLNAVAHVRIDGEREIQELITQYHATQKVRQATLKARIAESFTLNKRIDSAIKQQNKANGEKENAEADIKNLQDENLKLTTRKRELSKQISHKKPARLQTEYEEIEKKIAENNRLIAEKQENILQYKESIVTLNKEIKNLKKVLKKKKEEIKKIEEEITEVAEAFVENYINKQEEVQERLEKENDEYETLVGFPANGQTQPNVQMKTYRKKKTGGIIKRWRTVYMDENLENIISLAQGNLSDYVAESINNKWLSKKNTDLYIDAVASHRGRDSHERLYFASAVEGTNIKADRGIRLYDVINALKSLAVNKASEQISMCVKDSDSILKDEVDSAIVKIDNFAKELGVKGDENSNTPYVGIDKNDRKNYVPNSETVRFEEQKWLKEFKPKTENDKKKWEECVDNFAAACPYEITAKHFKLIKDLITPKNSQSLKNAGIYLNEIFGIPENATKMIDSEYFVGLPARGEGVISLDENDGRDFYAPKEPLINLPPLREVFHFTPEDYEITSKRSRKSKVYPSIMDLLDIKYKGTEYEKEKIEKLPEVWRYMLATPNMRTDGKYQQTFVEKSLSSKLKNYMDANGGRDRKYDAAIYRGGVLPCRVSGNRVMDIDNSANYRWNVATPAQTLPMCKEIKLSGNNNVQHLLADHSENVKETKDLQKIKGKMSDGLFYNYSELGQLLYYDKSNKTYRGPIVSLSKYLIGDNSNKNAVIENTVHRKNMERGAFSRNLFGSFLDVVVIERNTDKLVQKTEEILDDELNKLCEQMKENDINIATISYQNCKPCEEVEGECEEDEYRKCLHEQCVVPMKTELNRSIHGEKGNLFTQIQNRLIEIRNAKMYGTIKTKQNEIEQVYKKLNASEKKSVDERYNVIKANIEAFEYGKTQGDKFNLVELDTENNKAELVNALKDADAKKDAKDRDRKRALDALDNQNKVVPYCPIY